MHELSVAMSLIDVVTEHLIRNDAARARSFTVEIGALSGVEPAALRTAYATAVRGTELAETMMRIREVPVELNCPHCNARTAAIAPNLLRCAICNAPGIDIARGRELDVIEIEVD